MTLSLNRALPLVVSGALFSSVAAHASDSDAPVKANSDIKATTEAKADVTKVDAPVETPKIPGWRFHGQARAAVGFADTSSKAGATFEASDLFMSFSARAKDYVTLTELEGATAQISSQREQTLAQVRRAYVGYEPEGSAVNVRVGRLLLSGATRVGTEAVTRRNDEAFGRIDGLRIEAGGGKRPYHVGLVVGDTLGVYGASASMAESAMSVNVAAPGQDDAPKATRAGAFYADGCVGGLCGDLWYAMESNYFAAAPSTSQATVTSTTAPDGIVYQSLKHLEAGLHYTAQSVNVGAWYRKIWLKDPQDGAVKSNGDLVTATGGANSQWTEYYGLGVEYAAGGIAPKNADAPGNWFVGLSFAANRTDTDGLVSGSPAAKAEDDADLKQGGLSVGWRDLPATLSLNVLYNQTAGDAFPSKDGTPANSKHRTVVYSAFSFVM